MTAPPLFALQVIYVAAGCLFCVISFTHIRLRPFQADVGQARDLEDCPGFVEVLLFPFLRCRTECSWQRRMVALLSSLLQPKSGNKQQGFASVIDGPVALEVAVIFSLVQQTWKGGSHYQLEHVGALAY